MTKTGVKVVTHKGHEHNLKQVKAEVVGLKIDDLNGTEKISEAFGLDDIVAEKVIPKMDKYFTLLDSQDSLEEDLPQNTFVTKLVAFLESPTFKMLGWTPKTPNDYFMLGYFWAALRGRENLQEMQQMIVESLRKVVEEGDDE